MRKLAAAAYCTLNLSCNSYHELRTLCFEEVTNINLCRYKGNGSHEVYMKKNTQFTPTI